MCSNMKESVGVFYWTISRAADNWKSDFPANIPEACIN